MMRRLLFFAIWSVMVALMLSSCAGSKKSSSIRQIEKHSKKNPVDERGNPAAVRGSESKQVRQAMEKQQKRQAEEAKEAEKAYKDGITRHRAFQTKETRDRMDRNLTETNKRHRTDKEFFLVRWFKPKDTIEKTEKQRAKEQQKRMAATRKKAEKSNAEHGISNIKIKASKSKKAPDPKDVVHGGGGTYKKSSATSRVNPSDIQHGGGGSYAAGKSKGGAKPSDVQHGGGGSYKDGKKKKWYQIFSRR
jgi:hypothetical protein